MGGADELAPELPALAVAGICDVGIGRGRERTPRFSSLQELACVQFWCCPHHPEPCSPYPTLACLFEWHLGDLVCGRDDVGSRSGGVGRIGGNS